MGLRCCIFLDAKERMVRMENKVLKVIRAILALRDHEDVMVLVEICIPPDLEELVLGHPAVRVVYVLRTFTT
jgi:hypothetical protein